MIAFSLIGSYGIQLTNWGTDGYFVEDGQVKNYAVDERYKALISYLADLYSEGLINQISQFHEQTLISCII